MSHDLFERDEDGNKISTTTTRYDIRKCVGSDFESQYGQDFFSELGYINYCIDDPNKTITTIGTFEGYLSNHTFSEFTINIERCHDIEQCSDHEEIDRWLKGKYVKLINY